MSEAVNDNSSYDILSADKWLCIPGIPRNNVHIEQFPCTLFRFSTNDSANGSSVPLCMEAVWRTGWRMVV